jgi:hypothetical protein
MDPHSPWANIMQTLPPWDQLFHTDWGIWFTILPVEPAANAFILDLQQFFQYGGRKYLNCINYPNSLKNIKVKYVCIIYVVCIDIRSLYWYANAWPDIMLKSVVTPISKIIQQVSKTVAITGLYRCARHNYWIKYSKTIAITGLYRCAHHNYWIKYS